MYYLIILLCSIISMQAMEKVVGDLFIVPNVLKKIGQTELYTNLYKVNSSVWQQRYSIYTIDQKFVIPQPQLVTPHPDDYWVEVWATSQFNDEYATSLDNDKMRSHDWYARGHPILGTFPQYLPLSLLDRMKENDILRLLFHYPQTQKNVYVELHCAQEAYKYCFYGKFHDVLAKLEQDTVEQIRQKTLLKEARRDILLLPFSNVISPE